MSSLLRCEGKPSLGAGSARLVAVLAGVGVVACASWFGELARGTQIPGPASANPETATPPFHCLVLDTGGKPVRGIIVQVWGRGDEPALYTTDAAGRVVLLREAYGEPFSLLAQRGEELAWAWCDPRPLRRSAARGSGTPADPVVLTLLPRNRRISGVVVNRSGRPIAGVRVYVAGLWNKASQSSLLISRGQLEAKGWPLGSARTDGHGRYSLTLPQNTVATLAPLHERYVGPMVGVPEDAVSVDAMELEPAGTIAGTVTDTKTGSAVAGAHVGAQLLEHHQRNLGGWGDAFADAQGRFRIEGLEPGVYNLLLMGVRGRARSTAAAIEGVRVRAGEDAKADLKVIEGRPLRGVVIDSHTAEPAAGVSVGCSGPAHPRSGAAVESRRTDDLGQFTFYLPPGEQYVYLMDGRSQSRLSHRSVSLPEKGDLAPIRLVQVIPQDGGPFPRGFAQAAIKAAPPPEAKAKSGAVKIKPEPVRPERMRRQPSEVRTVTGQVMDRQGRPVAGIRVNAVPVSPPPGVLQGFDSAATDRDGIFVLTRLPRQQLMIQFGGTNTRETKPIAADQDVLEIEYQPAADLLAMQEPEPAKDEPLPPGLKDRLTFVSLDKRGNELVVDGPGGFGNDLARLPRGVHKLGETFYRVGDWMIHLRGQNAAQWPESVTAIAVGARADAVHFLHAVQQGDPPGTEVGAYVVHYTDGTSERIPLVYGRNLANWWRFPQANDDRPTEASVAWTGSNDTVDLHLGVSVRLFAMTWANPHPDRVIGTIDVTSKVVGTEPFLIAVTLERQR